MTRRRFAILLAFLLALGPLSWGAGLKGDAKTPPAQAGVGAPEANPAAVDAPEDDTDRVQVDHADQLRYDAKEKRYTLTGHVVFKHKDTTLYCDKATYWEEGDKKDTAVCTGHLRVIDPENDCTGDLINADFNDTREVIVITGSVVVVHQKKDEPAKAEAPAKPAAVPAGKDDGKAPDNLEEYKKKQTVIHCDRVEYYYNEQKKEVVATAERTGQVKAVQEDKTVTANKAVYEQIKDVITLTGNVHVTTDKGDEFSFTSAVISVQDNSIEGESAAGVTIRHKKKPDAQAPATPPAAPTQPPK